VTKRLISLDHPNLLGPDETRRDFALELAHEHPPLVLVLFVECAVRLSSEIIILLFHALEIAIGLIYHGLDGWRQNHCFVSPRRGKSSVLEPSVAAGSNVSRFCEFYRIVSHRGKVQYGSPFARHKVEVC
jgi:hypothetical protein